MRRPIRRCINGDHHVRDKRLILGGSVSRTGRIQLRMNIQAFRTEDEAFVVD
jgi:hypothetical protein